MSLGIPLSQLIQSRAEALRSGIPALDKLLGDGFQQQSIYEVYGPPGIGKTRFGARLVNENSAHAKCLWIDTFQQAPLRLLKHVPRGQLHLTRQTRFTQLWYMFHNMEERYGLIIIDGLSQVLVEYLQAYEKNGAGGHRATPLHDFKVKSLIQLLAAITRYATANNSVVVLLNDAMNTGFQDYSDDAYVSYGKDTAVNQFLVISQRKRHVQVLKSGLVANAAVGGKDARWEAFLRCRIGMFWNWHPAASARVPAVARLFVVHQPVAAASAASDGASTLYTDDDFQQLAAGDSTSVAAQPTKRRRVALPRRPASPGSSQIQFTPRIVRSDVSVDTPGTGAPPDVVYDSEG